MNILITGGAGYIGSQMVHYLNDLNFNIIVIDDLSVGNIKLIPKNIKVLKTKVGNQNEILKSLGKYSFDAAIHFAANVVVSESVTNPLKYYLNNTNETTSFIDTCIKLKINKFILSSTAAVYGNPETNIITENIDLKPESPYGMSKLMSETILKDVSNAHSLYYVILRYFNVAGADPKGRTGQISQPASHLIRIACEAALNKRKVVPIYGTDYDTPDGTCIRDYIHVYDLIKAHFNAIEYLKNGGPSNIFNCGYGRGFSVKDVIETVKMISKNNFNVEFKDRRMGDPEAIIANNEKIKNTLAWRPEYESLEKIITDAISWEAKI